MNPALNSSIRQTVKPDSTWQPLLDCAAREVFQIMMQTELMPTSPAENQGPGGDTTAMVGLAGSLCGVFSIRCASRTATSLAAKMLGSSDEPSPEETADAIAEICNMVAGNFKGKIAKLADHCMLSVPTVVRGEDYDLVTIADGERVELCLGHDGAPIWFSLVVHP